MAKKTKAEGKLEEQINLMQELVEKATAGKDEAMGLGDRLAMLDAVGRAAPQLARLMKAQRELESGKDDPMAVLREALAELEEEWPELRECRERLRNGGTDTGSSFSRGGAESAGKTLGEKKPECR